MLSVPGLLRCRPDELEYAAQRLDVDARAIEQVAARPRVAHWSGAAADVAQAHLIGLGSELRDLAWVVTMCAAVLRAAAIGWRPARAGVERAVAHAATHGLRVQCNGRVDRPTLPTPAERCVSIAEVAQQEAAEVAQALALAALRAAEEVDGDAAGALLRATAVLTARRPTSPAAATAFIWTPAAVPVGAGSREAAAWWTALPPEAHSELIASQPAVIGALNGVPASVRHAANMTVVEREWAAAETVLSQVHAAPGVLSDPDEYFSARGRLSLLESVRRELATDATRQLLTLNFGDGGHAAIAVGDVDRAAHVAVLVPGLNSDARGDLDNLVGDAERVRQTATSIEPGETVAVVAWIGYRTPGLLTVLFGKRAQAGGKRLALFVEGIDEARNLARAGRPRAVDPLQLTVVGHSYGSHATAGALRRTKAIDAAVFLGSPGVDEFSARQLVTSSQRLYVAEAGDDHYADLGGWTRTDPSKAGFGATPMRTGAAVIDGRWWRAPRGHSEYYSAGTVSLRRVAGVVVARPGG